MSIENREKAFEASFAKDQQANFTLEARTSKLLGLWAAGKMGLTGDEAASYAKEVVAANLDEPGYSDIKAKVAKDLQAKGVSLSAAELDREVMKAESEARDQLKQG